MLTPHADVPLLSELREDQKALVEFFLTDGNAKYAYIALHAEDYERKNRRPPTSGELFRDLDGLIPERTVRYHLARWRTENGLPPEPAPPPVKKTPGKPCRLNARKVLRNPQDGGIMETAT